MAVDDMVVFTDRCSVTAFDLKVKLSRDGRERGLWIILQDKSEARSEMYKKWIDNAIEVFVKMMGYKGTKKEGLEKFSAWLSLDGELRKLANGEVDAWALLEWPAIEKFHEAMGKAIEAGKLAAKQQEKEFWQWQKKLKKKQSTRSASSSSTSKRRTTRKTSVTHTAPKKKTRSTLRRSGRT